MGQLTFVGYETRDPYEAEARYKKRTGFAPTVIVTRPDFGVLDHPLLVRWNNGAADALLVSHLVKPSDIRDGKHSMNPNSIFITNETEAATSVLEKSLRKFSLTVEPDVPICPHCQSRIYNFEKLGFWYGWAEGIEPPYWDALRDYILDRDGYTCQKCHTHFKQGRGLRCHHIKPKEVGGTDSSRNLIALCAKCHEDEHPIMPEDDPSNLAEKTGVGQSETQA